MTKIFLSILVCTYIIVAPAMAADEDLSFVFTLYLSNGRLIFDRDYEYEDYSPVFDISSQKYAAPSLLAGEVWTGKLYNFDGMEMKEFKYSLKSGKNIITAPYLTDAVRVAFYNPSGYRSLAISVVNDGLSFCDFDTICRSDLQENGLTCPNDCPWEMPTVLPSDSPESSQPEEQAPPQSSFLSFIFLLIFFIIGFVVGYIIFRTYKAQ